MRRNLVQTARAEKVSHTNGIRTQKAGQKPIMKRLAAALLFLTSVGTASAQQVYNPRELRQVAEMAVLATYCGMPDARRTIDRYAKGIAGYDRVVANMSAELASGRKPDGGACTLGKKIMPGVLRGLKANPPLR